MAKESKTNGVEFSSDYQPPTESLQKGSRKRNIMTEALMKALHEEALDADGKKTKKLALIATKLADKATEGDTQAIKEIFDRTEGKAAQAITLMGDEDNPVQTKWTVEFINPSVEGK